MLGAIFPILTFSRFWVRSMVTEPLDGLPWVEKGGQNVPEPAGSQETEEKERC